MRTRSIIFFVVVVLLASIYPFIATDTLAQGTNPAPDPVYLPIVIKPAPTATRAPTATPIAPTATPTTSPSGDIDAPHLVTWSFAPDTVNVSAFDQTITFTIHLTDDLSGVVVFPPGTGGVPSQARFESPSGNQGENVTFDNPSDLISGTSQDGVYRSKMTLPRFSESGEWKLVRVLLRDSVGNARSVSRSAIAALGLPTAITVQN